MGMKLDNLRNDILRILDRFEAKHLVAISEVDIAQLLLNTTFELINLFQATIERSQGD